MRLFLTVILFSVTSAVAVSGFGDEILMLTEENPPFNFTADNQVTGIAVDLLSAAAEKAELDLDMSDIQMVPWARGYQMVSEIPGTLLFSMARTESRENEFIWVGPIVPLTIAVIGPESLEGLDIENLNGLRIGTIRDGAPEQLLLEQGVEYDDLYRGTSFEAIIRMMAGHRIDMIAYNVISARYQMHRLGINPDLYSPLIVLRDLELWYAFNKDTDPDLAAALQRGLNEVKSSGEYNMILAGYLEN